MISTVGRSLSLEKEDHTPCGDVTCMCDPHMLVRVRECEEAATTAAVATAHVMAIRCFKGYRSGIRGILHVNASTVLFYIKRLT